LEHRAIVDVVCKAAVQNLAGEIGTLLGQELKCSDIKLRLISKNTFFGEVIREKTALTRMAVSGDQEGHCYLLTRIDSAIYLGGTLIMLPDDMIEEHTQDGKLDGELEDAFGEVANIIAGVFTQAFVDKYPKTIRFIKKEVEELVPTKIDPDSDQPFPPGTYYIASGILKSAEKDLGPLELVVPAALLGLEELPAAKETATEQQQSAETAPAAENQVEAAPADSGWAAVEAQAESAVTPENWGAVAPSSEVSDSSEVPLEPDEPVPAPPPKRAFADAKKLTDAVFEATIRQIGEEIGALVGQDIKCDDIQLIMTSKGDFFATHCQEKSILTHMKVTGDQEGLGFLVMQTPDAIILGGTLIMLPEDQIEEQAQKYQFEGEVADAFGEIANILAGGLTQVFLDRYPKKLRFIKTDAEPLIPTKLDPDSDKPFPEGSYYLASFAIHMEGYDLHHIQLLFPARIFDLESGQVASGAEPTRPLPAAATAAAAPAAVAAQPEETTIPLVAADTDENSNATTTDQPVVLIISEQTATADPFVQILSSAEHSCKVLCYQDDIRQVFQQHQVLGVFLVMNQVGEKGFAAAIKLQSTGCPLPPLIFAGPEWTRSAVLRAAKYGARDIIIMPATGDEIQEKVSQHFSKAS